MNERAEYILWKPDNPETVYKRTWGLLHNPNKEKETWEYDGYVIPKYVLDRWQEIEPDG